MKSKKLIITADDFGLAETINAGIVSAHTNGFLRSTALLVNAPATNHAINLSKSLPNLEIGLHLSVVEGFAINTKAKTLQDKFKYFPNKKCLHRDWKVFLKKAVLNKICYQELYEELQQQVELFLKSFDSIPFLNVTQHLHMFPNIFQVILKLIDAYPINGLRIFNFNGLSSLIFNKKLPYTLTCQLLGAYSRKILPKTCNLVIPEQVLGIEVSGKCDKKIFKELLSKVNSSICEIVMHPGYDTPFLRECLPNSYNNFNWEEELNILKDEMLYTYITEKGFEITQFGELLCQKK